MPPDLRASHWLLPILSLIAGLLGITAAWVAIAILSNRGCGWLALLAAADMALLLRLTGAPPGLSRRIVALLATALAVALSCWMIVATHLGGVFGLGVLASALRLGPVLAWELTRLNLHGYDWAFIALSLPLAAWLAGNGRDEH